MGKSSSWLSGVISSSISISVSYGIRSSGLFESSLGGTESFSSSGEGIDDGLLSSRDGSVIVVGLLDVDVEGDAHLDVVAVEWLLPAWGFFSSSSIVGVGLSFSSVGVGLGFSIGGVGLGFSSGGSLISSLLIPFVAD